MAKIAILGANSHIAKGLINNFLKDSSCELYLFARNTQSAKEFSTKILGHIFQNCFDFTEFLNHQYDVIINCVGFGDPAKLKNAGYTVFDTIEKYDNLAVFYVLKHPHTLYINFSSGAVYGTEFPDGVNFESSCSVGVNKG
ncbi:MAG: hypothetical protein WCH01_03230 [Methylococcaceae bacterium]